jgi:hypothetical protein
VPDTLVVETVRATGPPSFISGSAFWTLNSTPFTLTSKVRW